MPTISIQLAGKGITTASLEWFRDAVNAAAGHSGEDFPVKVSAYQINCTVPAGEDK